MKLTSLTALVFAVALPAAAQELQPRDYSPTDNAIIRTIRVKTLGSGHNVVVVAVANRSEEPFNANFDCTLFDASGGAFGNSGGSANAVPPHQEVIAESISFDGKPGKVACRIEFTTPAR